MDPNDRSIDSQSDSPTVLPETYAAPDVQELGNCAELTRGLCCFFSEDSGIWC